MVWLLENNLDQVVEYIYFSWGTPIRVKDANGNEITDPEHIGNINENRYRGYRYDPETGLYYLESRYYSPEWGRFINADGIVDTEQGLIGTNMYAYCENNPIIYCDSGGYILKYTLNNGKYTVSGTFNKSPGWSPSTWSSRTLYANCYNIWNRKKVFRNVFKFKTERDYI